MNAAHLPCLDAAAERRLNLFLDGELPSAEEAVLFGHLAACAACRAQVAAWMAFRRAVREDPLPVPPAVDEALLGRLAFVRDAEKAATRRSAQRPVRSLGRDRVPLRLVARRRVPVGTAALIACVLFVLGLFVGRPEASVPLAAPVSAASPRIASGVVETVADDGGVVYLITPGVTVESGPSPTEPSEGWVQ